MRRLFTRLFRRAIPVRQLAPVRPRVTPDPARAEQLERQRSELAYRPEHGFLRDVRSAEDVQ